MNSTLLTALSVDDSVDALIDTLNTQALVEDQVKDSREHAHTDNFGCPTFEGTALRPIVTHLSLFSPLITTPHPLLPLSFKLPSQ